MLIDLTQYTVIIAVPNCKISWRPVDLFIIGAFDHFCLFFFLCIVNHTRYRDGHVTALCLRDLVFLNLGQRGHCFLVFIFFVEARQKLVLLGIYFFGLV